MLSVIQNLPNHVFGVMANHKVTANDLRNALIPPLSVLNDQKNEIYYLLNLETAVENFTAGAWFQDMVAGLKHLTLWKKMVIVTVQKAAENFTAIFSYISPSEAKGFSLEERDEAKAWLSLKA